MPDYFVHPSSYIDPNVSIGSGTKIWFFCHIQSGAVIGENCSFGQNVNVAAILKVNTYASLKTRYTLDGRDYKEFSKDIRQKPVSVDLMAGVGWKFLGVYAKYDPCRVLNKDFAPRFNAFSAGLTFFF